MFVVVQQKLPEFRQEFPPTRIAHDDHKIPQNAPHFGSLHRCSTNQLPPIVLIHLQQFIDLRPE